MRFRITWMIILSMCLVKSQAQRYSLFIEAKHLTWNVLYDYSHMSPAMVSYILDESDFRGTIKDKPKHFKMDYRLPPPRVKNSAFSFSGYQRGHLCPSGDRDSRKDWFKDTFYTSNIVPMTPSTNAGTWKETEVFCRRLASQGHRLKIACGPVWNYPLESLMIDAAEGLVNVIQDGTNVLKLVVQPPLANRPPALWKVAKCQVHQFEVYCWLVPNDMKYRPQSGCAIPADTLPRWLDPVTLQHLRVWLK